MKRNHSETDFFRELSMEENITLNGGGFAYDVGRGIRFLIISGGGNPSLVMSAIADAIWVHVQ